MINDKLIKDVYSTDEIKTNKVWLGKPVYRKLFEVNSFPNATNMWVNANITNLNKVIDLKGYATNGNEQIFLSSAYTSNIFDCLVFDYSYGSYHNSIRIHTASNRSSYSGYIIMEYTKTS